MTAFDPHAATEAFLAALPAAGHLKATHYTQGGHWLLLWGWLAAVAACARPATHASGAAGRGRARRAAGRDWPETTLAWSRFRVSRWRSRGAAALAHPA